MHNFLPENYEAPRAGGFYMKIQPGENKIRILSKAIVGWEDWDTNGKPVRFEYNNKPEKPISAERPIRHFWAFVVWNYHEEAIQILQVTQSGIRKGIEALCTDADWGAPYFYDIKIIKTGEELKTKYQVNPLPQKPLAPHIIKAFKDRPIFLEALFAGEDPFASHWPNKASLMIEEEQKKPEVKDVISIDQAKELNSILMSCDPKYKKSVFETLAKLPIKVNDLKDLPNSYYQQVKEAALRKRDEFNVAQKSMTFATV